MIMFDCDYLEGAHPKIMEALCDTNMCQTSGYGTDSYCEDARSLIKEACAAPDAEVYFLVGGTQTNTTVIASALRPYQGVLCAVTGHINVHESGAIEATGHKVIPLPSADGKVSADILSEYCNNYWNDGTHEHMVQPGMLYISQPTENGTMYTASELRELKKLCGKYSLYLYIDGARLGYALAADSNDAELKTIASVADVFYIGGTKVGALCGEAVVLCNEKLFEGFRYMIKQCGGLFAKGRILGIQFLTLFTDGLYTSIARRADELAYRVRDAFLKNGYTMLYESFTNQQFPVLPDELLEKLSESFSWDFWQRVDETHCAVRFCTSWATTEENVACLEKALEKLM